MLRSLALALDSLCSVYGHSLCRPMGFVVAIQLIRPGHAARRARDTFCTTRGGSHAYNSYRSELTLNGRPCYPETRVPLAADLSLSLYHSLGHLLDGAYGLCWRVALPPSTSSV